jgi:hypothetical protein
MRHRALILSSAIALSCSFGPAANAQMNPRGESTVSLAGKTIVVEYGRPSLKGRDMLGKAAVGDEWRMGADGATTFDTPVSLIFGSTPVAAGKYTLRAKKASDTSWVLKLVRDGQTAAEVPLQTSPLDKSVEVFTIDLVDERGEGVFRMSWGTLALAARFTVAK